MLPSIVYSSYKSSKKLFNEKNIPIQNTPNKEEKKCWFWNTPPSSMFLYACNLQMKKAKFVITNINADIEASTTFDFIRALYTMRSFWLILHELMYVVQRKLLSFRIKWGKCDDYRLKSVLYILTYTAYHGSYFTTLGITSIEYYKW